MKQKFSKKLETNQKLRFTSLKKISVLLIAVSFGLVSSHGTAREVSFSWEPFENVIGYQIEISENSKFEGDPKVKKGVKTPTLTIDLPMGTYFYRVRAVDQQKRPGHWSEPEKVIVTPYPPELVGPKNIAEFSYFEIPPKIDFTWKPTEGDPTYEVFVYKTTGKKIFEKRTKDVLLTSQELKEGEYLWKVRTIYKNIYISPYCEPRRFTIEKKPLTAPTLIDPIQDKTLPAYRPVQLTWEKDPSTHFTDITFTTAEGNKDHNIEKKNLSEVTTHSQDFEGVGTIQWRVVTKEGETTEGLSSNTEKFTLRKDLIADDNYSLEFGYSYSIADYNYVNGRSANEAGIVEATLLQSHLKGSYFLSKDYGLRFNLSRGTLNASDLELPSHDWNLSNSFRMGSAGFTQEFLLGYRQMNLFEFLPTPSSTHNIFTTTGPFVGTIIYGTVHRDWRIRLEGYYYKPIAITEKYGDYKTDVYEGFLGVGWNPFYKFWINYQLGYHKHVQQFKPDSASQFSKTNMVALQPFYITFSLEH